MAAPKFAIALSFPGEHRKFVKNVAARLAEAENLSRDLIFYDDWHQTSLLGPSLDEKLAQIYSEDSDLVVPFFSQFYSKRWCGIEWDAIRPLLLSRAMRNKVLPVMMDGTIIPGWANTGLGIQKGRMSGAQVADVILKKYVDGQWREGQKFDVTGNGQAATEHAPPPVVSPPPPPTVFISHHHKDVEFAREVKARLAARRDASGAPVCAPWLAADAIDAGDEYGDLIDEALRNARAIVTILTPESSTSMYVTYEWAYATGRGVPVIPVMLRLGGDIHPRLAPLQQARFIEPGDQQWERLLIAVERKVTSSNAMVKKTLEINVLKHEIRSEVAKGLSASRYEPLAPPPAKAVDVLLVIDIQQDFFRHGALPVPEAESLIIPLNRAIHAAEAAGMKVVFARDWHPSTHKSFVNMSPTGAWPRHCVQDTPGAAFHPKVYMPAGAKVINIGVDNTRLGYSAFEDDELGRLMDSPQTGTLYLAGIALEYCVQATALEAVGKYAKRVVIIENLVRATTTSRRELAPLWRELKDEGVERHVGPAPFLAAAAEPVGAAADDRNGDGM